MKGQIALFLLTICQVFSGHKWIHSEIAFLDSFIYVTSSAACRTCNKAVNEEKK